MAGTATPLSLIVPDWNAPRHVAAVSTTRAGGISTGAYASLNLGDHVGDSGHAVQSNRRTLIASLGLTDRPRWLSQVHGAALVEAEGVYEPPEADGSLACTPGVPCVVMTADCLPVLCCDRAGTHVAAVHCGWRSLAAGILDVTVREFLQRGIDPGELLVWLGPAIGPARYEVGDEVRAAFGDEYDSAFAANARGRWQLDLYALARLQLAGLGAGEVSGGGWCTADDPRFFSHRRDGQCGRQASLVWLKS